MLLPLPSLTPHGQAQAKLATRATYLESRLDVSSHWTPIPQGLCLSLEILLATAFYTGARSAPGTCLADENSPKNPQELEGECGYYLFLGRDAHQL